MVNPVLSESSILALDSKLNQRASTQLEFVTISNPNQLKSRKTQQKIRRHAGCRGAEKNKKNRRPPFVVFELNPADTANKQDLEKCDNTGLSGINDIISTRLISAVELRSLLRPLGAGLGLNPYLNFPIEYDERNSRLIEFLLQESTKNYHPMFQIWVSIGLGDKSSFHLLLANAATILKEQSEEEGLEATRHYTISLKSVNARINDPNDRTSEGLIGAILGFACQDARLARFERWLIHMRGLKRIIDMRGGMKTLTTAYALRLSIIWIDMNGSLALDCTPTFPPPDDLFDRRDDSDNNLLPNSTLENLKIQDIDFSDICEALVSTAKMARFINSTGTTQGFWRDDMIYFQNYLPVVHQVLSLDRRCTIINNWTIPAEIMRETLRLTILLLLGLVKRRFRIEPDCVPSYQERLLAILIHSPVDWTPVLTIYLWVLSISAAASFDPERMWIIAEISRITDNASWSDVSATVKSFIWIEEIAAFELDILGEKVRNHKEQNEEMLLVDIYG